MKLIDADALKQVTEESIAEYGNDYYTGDTIYGMRCVVYYATTDAPAVDAVPVIRCKDCVHWEKNNWNPNGMCNAFDDGSVCILTETDADEYCARAERKKE